METTSKSKCWLTCLAWCLLVSPSIAETLIPALGARSAGRAGANFAFDDSGFILHDNPSGLIGATQGPCGAGLFVEGTVVGLFPDLEFSDPENAQVSATNDPFGLGAFTVGRAVTDDLALGFGVYSPAGFGARWNLNGPTGPLAGPQFYKSIGMLIRFLPGVSYQATERLRVGATLGVAVSHVEIEGPYFVNSPPLTGTPTLLDLQATGAALTWSTGLQFRATDRLTLAARYQSQNDFENNGNANITIPGLGISSYDMTLGIIWPRSVGAGLKYEFSPVQRLGLDVDWQQWSQAADTVNFNFRDPSNPAFLAAAGPQVIDAIPLNWRDAWVVKAGLERDLCGCKTIRCGYSYNTDAIRGETTNPYLPTVLSHYFTAGYGWKKCGWEYDVAYQYSFRPTVHIGDSTLAGDDNSNGSLRTQAHWLFLGAGRRF